ncbi:condensation domain-containing protein [Streptomyces rimosus]|uniref:condensation domain-containing protein n=1 Tax=Streptomyces rimosus TaxID=1927 RepID=UPI0026E9EF84|nr:condensation domain-containing protein [Streptomyces rimosus]
MPDQVRDAAGQAFDLAAGLPVRARLFALGPEEHLLSLTLHHIATDGWSLAPLWRDLSHAYGQRVQGRPPYMDPLPVQYADYALWQRDLLDTDDGTGATTAAVQLAYWTKKLTGLPPRIALPYDRPRPQNPTGRSGTCCFRWDGALLGAVRDLARECGATVSMVVQAGLAALLTRLGAGEDIPIGIAVAGRTDTALHDLVGFFVNTLVLRVDTSGAPGFRTLVARVRETGLEAYAHQDVPVERVVDALRPDRTDDRHPLFQTLLVWQNTPDAAPELTGATTEARELHTGRLVTDLEISVTETPGREPGADTLAGAAHFNADLFDRATVEELLDGLRRLLMDVAADPDRPVGGLDTRAAGERGERETAAADELRTGLADERRAGLAYEPRTDLVDERRAAPAYEPRTVPAADEPRTAPADEPRAEQPAPTAAAPAPCSPSCSRPRRPVRPAHRP